MDAQEKINKKWIFFMKNMSKEKMSENDLIVL